MGLCQIGLSVTRRAVFGLLLVTAPVTTGACHPFKGAEHNRSPLVILPDPTVMIMFASDSNGIYRAEGCQRRGDVARRIGIVAGARAQGMPLVHVNLGDFVAMAKSPGGKSAARHIASSEALLAALAKPQLDGFVPGESELSLGRQNLLRIIEANDITALAANVVGPDHRPLFGIYAVTRRRGVRVGLVGIVEPAARTLPSLEADGYSFEKAEPALARAVELLQREQVDIIVGLFHVAAGRRRAEELLRLLPEPSWALVAAADREEQDTLVPNPRVVSTAPGGHELGRLDIHVAGKGRPFAAQRPIGALMTELLDGYSAIKLGDPAGMLEDEAPFVGIRSRMSRNAQLVTEILNGVRGTNWFAHFFVPIDATAPEDPAARDIQRRIEELHSKPLSASRRSGS